MEDKRQRLITSLTSDLVDLFVKFAQKRKDYNVRIGDLWAIKDTEQKAIRAIQELLDLGQRVYELRWKHNSILEDATKLMELSDTIRNGLRAWKQENGQNIVFLVMRIYEGALEDVKRFTDVIGEDLLEEPDIDGNIAFTNLSWRFFTEAMSKYYNNSKYFALMKQWWINSIPKYYASAEEEKLFDLFEWTEQDRLRLEEEVDNRRENYFKPQETKLWLLLARKFPRNGDETLKLKVYLQRKDEQHLVQLFLAHHSKNIDIRSLIPNMKLWPLTFSGKIGNYLIAMFKRIPLHEIDDDLRQKILQFNPDFKRYLLIRTATPKWILEIFANNIVPNSKDFFSLANQRPINENSLIYNEPFNFEELPSDIIYCIARLLSYKQIVPLSLTNKRIHSVVMKNEYIFNYLSRKYFTGMIVPATDFLQKLRLREYKYTMWYATFYNGSTRSLELSQEDLLVARQDPHATLSWYKFGNTKHRKLLFFATASRPGWTMDNNFSARLYKGHTIYAVHGTTISVLSSSMAYPTLINTHDIQSSLINAAGSGYFQLNENSLIGCGYWMDLTTNQIQPYPWTTDLYTVQMHSDDNKTGYGLDKSCKWLKQFDARTPSVTSSQSVVNVRDGVVQNFAVRNDSEAMFVVARHVSEWDRRFLHAPVRMSTDPNLTYSEHWGQYRPAIDLTSMKVIGREQIWDLADFTWKFDRNLHMANRFSSNGQLCVYERPNTLLVHRTGCNSYAAADYYWVTK